MTTTTNTSAQTTNFKLFVLFVVVVLSSTGVFAQNTTTTVLTSTTTQVSVAKEATTVIATENGMATMDVAAWLMGGNNTNGVKTTATNFGKKQLINAGVNTNSVLVRSFLKKVVGQESAVA